MTKKLMLSVFGVTLLAATVLAAPGHRFGTDIFHFRVQKAMANQGIEPAATGRVDTMHNEQGHASLQKLDLIIRGLTPSTPYELDAAVDGDPTLFAVDSFTTDAAGSAALHYQKTGNGQGNGQGNGPANGHGKLVLPGALDPVNEITSLAIVNTNVQPVLTADLMTPDHLQVLVKRDLSTADVSALFFLHANDNGGTIKIAADGLAPTNTYALAVNDSIVQVNDSDAKGRLSISTDLTTDEVLDLTSVSLLDNTGTNVIVRTSLP